MNREFICVLCPNGCEITTTLNPDHSIERLEGALCARGRDYVQQELYAPQRNIATSVKVLNGNIPLVSVRLTEPIPKDKIFDVMAEIRKVTVSAPVKIGQVIIADVLGLGRDVIATKKVSVV